MMLFLSGHARGMAVPVPGGIMILGNSSGNSNSRGIGRGIMFDGGSDDDDDDDDIF